MLEFNYLNMPKKCTDGAVHVSVLSSQAVCKFGQAACVNTYDSQLRGLENFVFLKLKSPNSRLIAINGRTLSNLVRNRINSGQCF